MRKSWILVAALAAAPAFAVPVPADPFTPALALPGTTAAAEPALDGALVTSKVVPFTTPDGGDGRILMRVVKSNTTGKLIFTWMIANHQTSKKNFTQFTIRGWPKKIYDANWRKDGLGSVAPTSIQRFFVNTPNSPPGAGDLLVFKFGTPMKPGETSRMMFLRTDATKSTGATVSVTASQASVELIAFGPAF